MSKSIDNGVKRIKLDDGTAAEPSLSFQTDDTTGMFYDNGGIGFSANGAHVATLSANGLVFTDAFSNYTFFPIASRAAKQIHPDQSLAGFNYVLNAGAQIVEAAVRASNDAFLYCFDDSDIDTETNGTGAMTSNTSITLDDVRFDATPVPTRLCEFVDLLRLVKTRSCLLFVEDRTTSLTNTGRILQQIMNTGISSSRVLIESMVGAGGTNNIQNLSYAKTLGYNVAPKWAETTNTGTAAGYVTIANALSATAIITGFTASYSQSVLDLYLATGMYVFAYTINRRYLRDLVIAAGLHGYFSEDWAYVTATEPMFPTPLSAWEASSRTLSDSYGQQIYMPGMLAVNDSRTMSDRGYFFSTVSAWGWQSNTSGAKWILQGWSGPFTCVSSQLSISLYHTRGSAVSSSSWTGVFLHSTTMSDRTPVDDGATTTDEGYKITFQKDGTVTIYKVTAGVAVSLGSQGGAGTLVDGTYYYSEVTFNKTTHEIYASVVGPTDLADVLVIDSTYTPEYASFGSYDAASRFKSVTFDYTLSD